MSIKATIDHSHGKYAVSDNGYILLLDSEGHELKKYPLDQIGVESGTDQHGTYNSLRFTLPDYEIVEFNSSKYLPPFAEALNKELKTLK